MTDYSIKPDLLQEAINALRRNIESLRSEAMELQSKLLRLTEVAEELKKSEIALAALEGTSLPPVAPIETISSTYERIDPELLKKHFPFEPMTKSKNSIAEFNKQFIGLTPPTQETLNDFDNFTEELPQ